MSPDTRSIVIHADPESGSGAGVEILSYQMHHRVPPLREKPESISGNPALQAGWGPNVGQLYSFAGKPPCGR